MSQTDALQVVQSTESGQPRLTLAVDTPSSASPFPSPSSAFLPPPIPSSHEFANRIVQNPRYRAKSVGNKDKEKDRPKDVKMSTTSGNALGDDSKGALSTRSAGASPAKDAKPLPSFVSTDPSRSAIVPPAPKSATLPIASSQQLLLVPSPTTPRAAAPPSYSSPPVVTIVEAASMPSNAVATTSSVPKSATPSSSLVTNHTVRQNSPSLPGSLPAQEAALPKPVLSNVTPTPRDNQPHPSQPTHPPETLFKLHTQESSADIITPVSLKTGIHELQSNAIGDTPDQSNTDYDGMTTPIGRPRPESTASLSAVLAGAGGLSRAGSLSISSSRPAPPSPAPSRRASQQLIRRNSSLRKSTSSVASANGGANLGRSASTRSTTSKRNSTLSMSSLTPPIDGANPGSLSSALSPTMEQPGSAVEENHPPRPIVVRDFAYQPDEEWFSARPPELLPRSEREVKRESGASGSRSSKGLGNWMAYSPGSRALGAKSGKKKKKSGWAALGKFLSKRNSGQPEPESEDLSEDEYDDDDGEYEDHEYTGTDGYYQTDGGGEGPEEELRPGLYRALYAFEPEGTAEMALVEDQIVRVVGRGGGVGWAIVERPPEKNENGGFGLEAAGQALVPESYLEPYQLDDEYFDD